MIFVIKEFDGAFEVLVKKKVIAAVLEIFSRVPETTLNLTDK